MIDSFICFGDSHSRCFNKLIKTYDFSASSAQGLNNSNSLSGTNKKIKELITNNNYKNYIFFFGKVDNDWIFNHKYNIDLNYNFEEHIIKIVRSYLEFIKNLDINNVFICELPLSHINDETLLTIINRHDHTNNLNKHIADKYIPIRYNTVLPLDHRNKLLLLFNTKLKIYCKEYNFSLLEINKYFYDKSSDKYKIPDKYINKDIYDHHLSHLINELYIKSLDEILLLNKKN